MNHSKPWGESAAHQFGDVLKPGLSFQKYVLGILDGSWEKSNDLRGNKTKKYITAELSYIHVVDIFGSSPFQSSTHKQTHTQTWNKWEDLDYDHDLQSNMWP
jgi:hypothetical protein